MKMGKFIGRELAERLSTTTDTRVRREDVTTELGGGWVVSSWNEIVSMPVPEFAALLEGLGESPTEAQLLVALGTELEGVRRKTLQIYYGYDPRRGEPTVRIQWRAMSADAPSVYLANLTDARKAVMAA